MEKALWAFDEELVRDPEVAILTPPYIAGYKPTVDEFIDYITTGKEPLGTPRDAKISLEVCLAAYESVRIGGVVELPLKSEVAALITEPYQGGSGSIIPPQGYMDRLQEWCQEHEILFILHEVQSSFGRTGRMFALEHYHIKPNLLFLGKGINGGGVPTSALMGESRIMDVLQPGEMSSTHGGNPLSCANYLI